MGFGRIRKADQHASTGTPSHCWLHARYTYDLLLVFVGLPSAVAAATMFGQWLCRRYFAGEAPPQLAGFILAVWVSLLVFRLSFSAIRWLFPLVEYAPPVQPLHRQIRVALSVLLLALLSSVAATALLYAFAHN